MVLLGEANTTHFNASTAATTAPRAAPREGGGEGRGEGAHEEGGRLGWQLEPIDWQGVPIEDVS